MIYINAVKLLAFNNQLQDIYRKGIYIRHIEVCIQLLSFFVAQTGASFNLPQLVHVTGTIRIYTLLYIYIYIAIRIQLHVQLTFSLYIHLVYIYK